VGHSPVVGVQELVQDLDCAGPPLGRLKPRDPGLPACLGARFDDVLLAREVAGRWRGSDFCLGGDVRHGRPVEAVAGEAHDGRVENLFAADLRPSASNLGHTESFEPTKPAHV
jgi:hypothetical protein